MHALLGLSSLALVVLGGYLALGILRHLDGWLTRRDLQLLVLAAPVISLAVGVGGLHHFAGRACFDGAPTWDRVLWIAIPLAMAVVAIGGVGLGLVRAALLSWGVVRRGRPAGPGLQAVADDLARRLGAPPAPVLLYPSDRPLALACGLTRPVILVSTWIVRHLDQQELEAVLAHELAHVARHDYQVIWLATVLRDAFCYLPTSRAAYVQLQRDKEWASDDLVVGTTRQPLALASALAKVWQQALGGPALGVAPTLAAPGQEIEVRIQRLLSGPQASHKPYAHLIGIGGSIALITALLALEAMNLALISAPMGCNLASYWGHLLWRATLPAGSAWQSL